MEKLKKIGAEKCYFCGRTPEYSENGNGNFLIASNEGQYICYGCIAKLYRLLKSNDMEGNNGKAGAGGSSLRQTPAGLKEYLDGYVIGQDKAKKIISVAIYNHFLRVRMKKMGIEGADEIEKSNILMVGPSGTGKTALIRHMAKALDVPFVIEDISSYSSTGYVGRDLECMLKDLVQAAGGNMEKAQCGIIYIDEIDKCSRKGESPSTTADPSHEDLQQGLLKFIEGTEVEVAVDGQRHHPNAKTFRFNTENVLFIAGGAFEGIEKIIAKRHKKSAGTGMGFGSNGRQKDDTELRDLILDVKPEDLRKFGMLPELLGRLPVICPLEPLTEEALSRILTEPKNAVTKQYGTMFAAQHADLEFTDSAVRAVARKAMELKTGARSLKGIIEQLLIDTMFRLPDMAGVKKVTVDTDNEGNIITDIKEYSISRKGA